ncbi:MAG: DUF6624 domain-containing protein [Candidatus Dependentiae bacterium]
MKLFIVMLCNFFPLFSQDNSKNCAEVFKETKKLCLEFDKNLDSISIAKKELEALNKLIELTRKYKDEKLIKKITVFNAEQLKKIMLHYQWPCIDTFGTDYDSYAWSIVQQANHDQVFQFQCLMLIRQLAKENRVSKKNYAYLYDHLAFCSGLKQRYGTKVVPANGNCEIAPCDASFEIINARRTKKGINSIEEYLEKINKAIQKK